MNGMLTIGGIEFPDPESPDGLEATKHWRPTTAIHPLHRNCIVYARTRIEGAWKAYVILVPGFVHEVEAEHRWQDEGVPLRSEKVARAMFPEFDDIPYSV